MTQPKVTIRGKKTMKEINREFAEYLTAFAPKKVREYEENGLMIKVYDRR
jgi:hypothetical protein